MVTILHNQPTIGEEEVKSVEKVLRSHWIIAGEEVAKFEETIKTSVGMNYAIAVNSGHSALHLGLLALGVNKDSEVIVPDYTPADIVNPIYYAGATPVIVDIEKDGFTIDPKKVAEKITHKTKAIIVPHIFGFPAKIDEIKKFTIPVLEDCAQAIGSYYRNRPLGSFGDITIFSFYATKIMTTGQGGMIVTNSKKYYEEIKDMIDYNGRDTSRIRYNYPMTDIAAAMGNVQFKKLPDFIKRRKKIADRYRAVLKKTSLQYWPKEEDTQVNHFRFIVRFPNTEQRDRVKKAFEKHNIMTIIPYAVQEILHNVMKKNRKHYPNAESMAMTTLSLPIYPGLKETEIDKIVTVLERISL